MSTARVVWQCRHNICYIYIADSCRIFVLLQRPYIYIFIYMDIDGLLKCPVTRLRRVRSRNFSVWSTSLCICIRGRKLLNCACFSFTISLRPTTPSRVDPFTAARAPLKSVNVIIYETTILLLFRERLLYYYDRWRKLAHADVALVPSDTWWRKLENRKNTYSFFIL